MQNRNFAPAETESLEPEAHQTTSNPADKTLATEDNHNPIIAINPEGIPGELKELPQSVCWRLVPQGDGKKDKKEPINPKTGGRAQTNNPKTWDTFNQAWDYYQRNKGPGCGGIGFVFAEDDPYVGIDLDGCRDPETGTIEPWAMEIVQRFNSYTEVSVSGSGLHIIAKGELPGDGKRKDSIEIYDAGRYFTVTGHLLPGTNPAIEACQEMVLKLYARLTDSETNQSAGQAGDDQPGAPLKGNWQALIPELKQAVLTPEGQEILRQLEAGQHRESYQLLYQGDWQGAGYPSPSEADLAMFNFLYRRIGDNHGLVYAIIKETGLGKRKKMDDLKYVARTMQKALDGKHWRPDGRDDSLRDHLHVVRDRQSEGAGSEDAPGSAREEGNRAECTCTGEARKGCTPASPPHNCGPSIREGQEGYIPHPAGGCEGAHPAGWGDRAASPQPPSNNNTYKRKGISSPISPSTEAKALTQTPKNSMAARIRKIALRLNREFTVGEIASELVKYLSISPLPSTPEEWEPWNKRVSNELGRLVKQGILVRVKGKKGVYHPSGYQPENAPGHLREDKEGDDTLRILRVIPKPLPMRLPLGLERYVLIYPGDFIVVAGATNAGKTAFFLILAWLNWNLVPVNYLTSELSEVRLAIRLHDFCAVHGTSLDEWDEHVVFKKRSSNFALALNPAWLNVVDYLEIYKDFQEAGLPMKEMFKRQQGQPGVTFVGLQMKHGNVLGRGGSLGMEKPFLYLTIDYFQECGLNRLVIEKAKDPANKNINPNGMDFWFKIEEGCKFVSVETPKDAGKLIDKARKQANGGK